LQISKVDGSKYRNLQESLNGYFGVQRNEFLGGDPSKDNRIKNDVRTSEDNAKNENSNDTYLLKLKGENTPQQMIFRLERFAYTFPDGARKLKGQVELSDFIDFDFYPETVVANEIRAIAPHRVRMQPRAVVVHQGTLDEGHYYTYVLDAKRNTWVMHNDTHVRDVSTKDALKDIAENGYIFLYDRRALE
jgi:ubiquitin C-terminal hydrolase